MVNDNPRCTAIANADSGLSCTLKESDDRSKDTLTIINALPDGMVAGKVIRIGIDKILNPLSLHRRDFFTALAVISQNDGRNYHIQEGLCAFSARKPTTIRTVKVSSTDTTV